MEPVTVRKNPLARSSHPTLLTELPTLVPRRPLHPHLRLSLVPLPQPRSILSLRAQPHHLPAANKALRRQRFRFTEMGSAGRRSEWV